MMTGSERRPTEENELPAMSTPQHQDEELLHQWEMRIRRNLAAIQAVGTSQQWAAVELVAVSKYASLLQMEAAYRAGVRAFGENKVQDALAKQEQLPVHLVQNCRWHFIGQLQKNKVNKVVGRFHLLHSVDSFALAEKISNRAQALHQVQPVLLQVNWTGEASKAGFAEKQLQACIHDVLALPGLAVQGFMTLAEASADQKRLDATFGGLFQLRNHLQQETGQPFPHLSMGMSGDYSQALAHGATILRIGSKVFQD